MSPSFEIRRALLSGANREAMVELARTLDARGVKLYATRGTASALEAAGMPVVRLEDWLGFEEILGGRVKTLHPKLHAALLAPRTPEGLAELDRVGAVPLDLVAVELYAFRDWVRAHPGDAEGGIEHVDIGGVAMLRAAGKNREHVAVLADSKSRAEFLADLPEEGIPQVTVAASRRWAAGAFRLTSAYDAAIADWMEPAGLGPVLAVGGVRSLELRYGENPHQQAAWYEAGSGLPFERLHEGRDISWNNLLDVHAATALVARLPSPVAVVVKHTNPCGAARGGSPAEALAKAWAGDPLSAFGGILALSGTLDGDCASQLEEVFLEVVVAPEFTPEALDRLRRKKGLRILKGCQRESDHGLQVRSLLGGLGAQVGSSYAAGDWKVVSGSSPTANELADLELAWNVCAAGQSNAIALVRAGQLLGLGSGQTSRVDAVHMALYKAGRCGHDVRGAALASDGFFPFRDGVDLAASAGIRCIVQPGGSRRDPEVVAAAAEHDLALVHTGVRTFRH